VLQSAAADRNGVPHKIKKVAIPPNSTEEDVWKTVTPLFAPVEATGAVCSYRQGPPCDIEVYAREFAQGRAF